MKPENTTPEEEIESKEEFDFADTIKLLLLLFGMLDFIFYLVIGARNVIYSDLNLENEYSFSALIYLGLAAIIHKLSKK